MGENDSFRIIAKDAATIFLLCLAFLGFALLTGCDGEVERLQAEAAWNAKIAHAATPQKGELVTIHQYADGRFVIRRYEHGLKSTDLIARDQ